MKEKIIRNKITIISFISSMLVIYFHTRNLGVYGIDETSTGIGRICYLIETNTEGLVGLATPIFFFISGLLFFRTYELKDTKRKFKSRFFSLILPYIIWCSIYYLYLTVLSLLPTISNILPEYMIRELSISSWINSLFEDSYYVLWFLKNLIIYIYVSPLLYLLLKNYKKTFPNGLLILVLIIYVLLEFRNSTYLNGLEYYLLGSYIGINLKDLLYYKNKKISILSTMFLIGMLLTDFRYINIITTILFIVSLWSMLDSIELNKELPWWLNVTFFSYVLHDLVLEALEKLLLLAFGTNCFYALVDYLFMPIIVEMIIIVIAYMLNKYLPKLYMILSGYRPIFTK